MMGLSTFGAIMGFAAEIVGQTKTACEALIEKAKNSVVKETLQQLAVEEGKTYSLMEQVRREHVTEMILEPITGLREEDYAVDLKRLEQKEDSDLLEDPALLKVAIILEEREKKFFQDASAKVSLPEVARIFRKISRKREENLERLRGLGRLTSP